MVNESEMLMKRSKFSLSHYKLFTGDMGLLYPITWYSVLPGDSIQHRTQMLIRLSPLLSPVMHPVRVRVNSFFVPFRLIWNEGDGAGEKGWEDFITGGSDGEDDQDAPMITAGTVSEGDLADYLGIPPAAYAGSISYSALPFRAYSLIYNEYYRDQDLCTELTIDTSDGTDSTTNTSLQRVSWEKDYFTASRPWEQKGSEVTIPIGGNATVLGIGMVDGGTFGTSLNIKQSDGTTTSGTTVNNVADASRIAAVESGTYSGYPDIYADLSAATGLSINDLRLYLALQRYKENRAEFGSRYVEYLRSLGVRSSDARLNNPEYLGGARQTISFSEVLSTNDDDSTDYAGRLRGHGIAALRSNRYRRFFEEHGIVMTMMSVVPKAIYATGLNREWSKTTKEDYFQKELAHIGDQAILNQEVYTEDTSPTGTFSYQTRYDEYRFHPSGIAGEFRSSLNHWHYARLIASDPAINSTFIECNPTKRQYADNASDVLYVMANHSIQARRIVPSYPRKRVM